MDLNAVEARLVHEHGGVAELLDSVSDLRLGHGSRLWEDDPGERLGEQGIAGLQLNRARR
jgi:hypothetical protein